MADDGDDVLDNWEDEDTEVLERRMEERQKQHVKTKKKQSQPKPATTNKESEDPPPVVPLEVQTHLPLRNVDTARTEYVAPIKILKRQVEPKGTPSVTQASGMSAKQRKSLAEREADYASARARILGTGYGVPTDDSPTITTKSSPSPSSASRGSGPSPSSRKSPSSYRGPDEESVKRQPKGPNGTKGFRAKAKS